MSKKIGCVVYYTDDRYDELAKNVKNSFLAHNGEECDYHQIDYTNQEEYNKMLEYYEFAPETFLMQFIYAYEIMKKYNYEKICSNVRWVSPFSCRSCKFVSTS